MWWQMEVTQGTDTKWHNARRVGWGVLSNWQCPLFRPRTARDKEIGPEQLHFSTEAEPLLCSPSLGKWLLQNVVSNCRPQTGASP